MITKSDVVIMVVMTSSYFKGCSTSTSVWLTMKGQNVNSVDKNKMYKYFYLHKDTDKNKSDCVTKQQMQCYAIHLYLCG